MKVIYVYGYTYMYTYRIHIYIYIYVYIICISCMGFGDITWIMESHMQRNWKMNGGKCVYRCHG